MAELNLGKVIGPPGPSIISQDTGVLDIAAGQYLGVSPDGKIVGMDGGEGGSEGHSPYIGENGNWYEWRDGAFVDTGVQPEGKVGGKGDPGPNNISQDTDVSGIGDGQYLSVSGGKVVGAEGGSLTAEQKYRIDHAIQPGTILFGGTF